MALITFIEANGTEHKVTAETGETLMQVAVDHMVEGIVGECGGCCSCATCHCYVDDAWMEKVGAPDDVEEGMLECVPEQRPNSRLSCQIEITDAIDGLVVKLPDSQY